MSDNFAIQNASFENIIGEAWIGMQSTCPHRNPKRDDEGQGKICEHDDNESNMDWCSIGHCPRLVSFTD